MKFLIVFVLISCTTLKPIGSKNIELDTLSGDVKEQFDLKEIPATTIVKKKVEKIKMIESKPNIEITDIKPLFNPKIGETMTYSVYAPMGIKAGTLITNIVGKKKLGNKEVIHIKSNLYNSSFFASVFKVNLLVESFIDPIEFKSLRYQISGQEGSIFKENVELYDYINKKTIVLKKQKTDDKSSNKQNEYPLMFNQVQDILSSFYYVKENDFENNPELKFTIISDKKVKNATAKKLRNEKLDGINCSVLGVAFENNQKLEDNLIWLDKNKKVIKIVSSMKWGTFKIILEK